MYVCICMLGAELSVQAHMFFHRIFWGSLPLNLETIVYASP